MPHAPRTALVPKPRTWDNAPNPEALAPWLGHIRRFAKFCCVGLSGVAVNLGVLWLLRRYTTLSVVQAGALAVAVAMLSNFACNELWTFDDVRHGARRPVTLAVHLASYLAICSLGASLNVTVLAAMSRIAGFPDTLAALVGIGVAAVWNYGWNARVTWRPRPAARSPRRAPSARCHPISGAP